MEMFHIVLIDVAWCDVSASSKPPHSTLALEQPIVEVHSGSKRIAWMDDGTQPHTDVRNPISRFIAFALSSLGNELIWQCTLENTKVNTRFLEHLSLHHHTRAASATSGFHPSVLLEFSLAVKFFKSLADVVLSVHQHSFELFPNGDFPKGYPLRKKALVFVGRVIRRDFSRHWRGSGSTTGSDGSTRSRDFPSTSQSRALLQNSSVGASGEGYPNASGCTCRWRGCEESGGGTRCRDRSDTHESDERCANARDGAR
mmetsp:Transcript_23709/g.46411  ORF Transcript_23709/g.46411 Transcript_23709/m.46411 type:complete len:257 (-) Transcript_23709:32-802(-)